MDEQDDQRYEDKLLREAEAVKPDTSKQECSCYYGHCPIHRGVPKKLENTKCTCQCEGCILLRWEGDHPRHETPHVFPYKPKQSWSEQFDEVFDSINPGVSRNQQTKPLRDLIEQQLLIARKELIEELWDVYKTAASTDDCSDAECVVRHLKYLKRLKD